MSALTVRGVRAEHVGDGRTVYWVALEDEAEEPSVVIDETTGITVVERDSLAAHVGQPAAALISRLVLRRHQGEEIEWPQEIVIEER